MPEDTVPAPKATNPTSNIGIPVAIVVGFAMIAAAIYFSGSGNAPAPTAVATPEEQAPIDVAPVTEADFIRGNPNAPITVVEYSDYDCPFCKNYVHFLALKKNVTEVVLVDARKTPELYDFYISQQYDLNHGMIVDIEGRVFYGYEAVHILALMTDTNNNFFLWLQKTVFSNTFLAKYTYPLMMWGRRIVLKLFKKNLLKGVNNR